jgi:hypothetical protein
LSGLAELSGLAAVRADERPLSFNRDIRHILSNNCFQCHGPDESERHGGGEQGLRLDTLAGATADLGGHQAIVPGNPDASDILRRITSTDPDIRMPPPGTGKKVSAEELDRLKTWIAQGAPYARHWSYEPPVRVELPTVLHPERARNAVDLWLQARLDREGLAMQPEADRYTLIRRLSLDLTGLPPTWEQVEQFVNDTSPTAYEELVDRLMEHPGYGEHWARLWLDLARYADSAGYADDPPRVIWGYRDYVIRAFRRNMPFDQFTVEQLAGDLLPNPTDDQLVATAFHRNTLTNNEGGTNDEEFRNVAVIDRVNTTFAVWMGTTINCAQCHTHKYDPITHAEFFRVYAILNQTQDADRTDESPRHELWDPASRAAKQAADAALAQLETDAAGWETASAVTAIERTDLQRRLRGLQPYTSVPVMRAMAAEQQRKTNIQLRGNWQNLGDEVTAGVPAAFHPLTTDAPVDRLALAKWLIDRNNPLTARVMVNRLWEQIFGIGIVATSEEFGSQGEGPVHPELLDWLAVEFMDSGWNWRHMLKLLVTSAAYRQSSVVTDHLQQRDPDNRLLARGPRFRMSAEMIRDQALAVSGLLSFKDFGPPVRPLQPKMGVNAAFGSAVDWQTSDGEDRHRRALYTTWRRSNPYPSMTTFDAPNREVCTLRRERTNTPLQALVTLNDPVYIEAAQALARAALKQTADPAARAEWMLRQTLARPAESAEVARLITLQGQAKTKLATVPEQAAKLATVPIGPVPENTDVLELAAWTVVANAVLNLDEILMRR